MPTKFIRTITCASESERVRLQERLNSLGFYCLSGGGNDLNVHAIEYTKYPEEKFLDFLKDWCHTLKGRR